MRIFRLLLLSALFLFLVITAISLLIPSHIRISRAANIHATAGQVWQQVDDMQSWTEWNPFFNKIPSDNIKYTDTSNGKPAAMEINETLIQWKELKPDERIAIMTKEGKKPVISGWKYINQPGADSATLQWYIDFELRWYPWEKFSSLLFENSYGAQMEQGLINIKKMVEANRTSIN